MKKYSQFLKELPSKTVVFAFGRFNPPTSGHELLVKAVKKLAASNNADHAIYASKSQDAKKNPLTVEKKVHYLNLMFPNTHFVAANPTERTFIEAAKSLNKKYKNIIMVAGSDRVPEYEKILNKYNGTEFHFDTVQVISAGERDPDADDASGMSASKMRALASKGDYNTFKKGLPSTMRDIDGRRLMNDVRQGMGLDMVKEQINLVKDELREQYFRGEIFNIGDIVESAGVTYEIVKRGSNHLLLKEEEGKLVSKWIQDVTPAQELKLEEEMISEDLTDKTLKSQDKIKVARVIATILGIENAESSSNAEQLVNLGLRKAKTKTLNKDSLAILQKMLGLATEVGIQYDNNLVPTALKEAKGTPDDGVVVKKSTDYNAAKDKLRFSDYKKLSAMNNGHTISEPGSSLENKGDDKLRRMKIKEETHRVAVTVSEPDHPAVTKRKEQVQKFIRVKADSKETAVDKAKAHYKKAGYKVHGVEHHSVLTEEQLNEISKELAGNYYGKVVQQHLKKVGMRPNMYDRMAKDLGKKRKEGVDRALNRITKEETILEGAYEKAEENKRSADAAKKQGDMFAHHLHMADHHDNLAQWHSEKGRHGEADRHAAKAEEHHDKAMSLKEGVDLNESHVEFRLDHRDKVKGDHKPTFDAHGAKVSDTTDKATYVKVPADKANSFKSAMKSKHGVTVELAEETTPYWKKASWIKKMSQAAKQERLARERKEKEAQQKPVKEDTELLEYEIHHDGKGNYRDDEGNEWNSKTGSAHRSSFGRRHTVTSNVPHAVHINGKKWKTFGSQSHAQNVANKIKGATVHKEEVELDEGAIESSWSKIQKMDKGSVLQGKEGAQKRLEYLKAVHDHHKKFGNDTKKVKSEIERINRSRLAEEEMEICPTCKHEPCICPKEDEASLGANNAKGFDPFFKEDADCEVEPSNESPVVDMSHYEANYEDNMNDDGEDFSDEELDDMADEVDDIDDVIDVYDDEELAIVDDETGEEIEHDDHEMAVNEEALMEVLSRMERMKAKMRIRRSKAVRERKMKIALKTYSTNTKINERSRRLAVKLIKKRLLRGRDASKISVGEKERIERIIEKRKAVIGRLAMRLSPRVRKIEKARMSHTKFTKGAQPSVAF